MRLLPARRQTRVALAVVATAVLVATGLYVYRGWQSHYLGRPADWWARRLSVLPLRGPIVATPPTPAEWFLDRAIALVGAVPPSGHDLRGNGLLRGDPLAVPVLIDLVGDPDPRVRYWVADGLRCVTPPAREAVPALVAAVRKYGRECRGRVTAGGGDGADMLEGVVMRIDEAAAADVVLLALEDLDPDAAGRAGAFADDTDEQKGKPW